MSEWNEYEQLVLPICGCTEDNVVQGCSIHDHPIYKERRIEFTRE